MKHMSAQKIIEKHISNVERIAGKFEYTNIKQEDLISIGCIGLIKAANKIDKDVNNPIDINQFIDEAIESEILKFLNHVGGNY